MDHLEDAVRWVVRGDLPGDDALVKSQSIRILDVIAIGPLMVWGGLTARRAGGAAVWAGWALALLGIGTLWYNALNWHRVNEYSRQLDLTGRSVEND
jgi:hypothetical protein